MAREEAPEHLADIAITGFAGPAGKRDEAGLVHIMGCARDAAQAYRQCHFGDCGRERTRYLAAGAALEILETLLAAAATGTEALPTRSS